MAYQDDIQKAIQDSSTDSRPTIERGSYGDHGPLEAGRKDGGVGKPNENQPSPPARFANVAVDAGSKLTNHAVEMAGFLGATAAYHSPDKRHPQTGSPIPGQTPDDDYAMSGVKQQEIPDTDND